jgi:hypothetical protein
MTFTADQYSKLAVGYQKAATDPSITPEKREEFARKAEWFRFLADRLGGTHRAGGTFSEESERSETAIAVEPSSREPERSVKPLLTTLWVTGAAIYLIGMVLLTNNVVNLFRQELENKRSSQATRLVSSLRVVANNQETGGNQPAVPASSPAPHRRHAISPDEPRYEAPGLIVPPAISEEGRIASAPRPQPTSDASAPPPSTSESETLKVTATAQVLNGPSRDSEVIGTAIVTPASPKGGSLEVTRSEEVPSGTDQKPKLDPVAPPRGEGNVTVTRSEQAPSLTPRKPKPVKKRVRQKTSEPPQLAKERPSRPSPPDVDREYADLPENEEFLADGPPPRMGFFARRRMLREGLMSPDFIPPR